ncbi:hypothetical protein [Algoriphagus sp. NG3]|nr:hypothetical protein [Algoriphagus sp. NG3]WPR77549.1 hypothetical protein SLW71_09335 [Algoriphagus sp. NG3]
MPIVIFSLFYWMPAWPVGREDLTRQTGMEDDTSTSLSTSDRSGLDL